MSRRELAFSASPEVARLMMLTKGTMNMAMGNFQCCRCGVEGVADAPRCLPDDWGSAIFFSTRVGDGGPPAQGYYQTRVILCPTCWRQTLADCTPRRRA